MAWVAIDAGTSVIKSVAFADDGRELGVARERTAVLRPEPGWSEQDMHEVWAAVVCTVRRVAGACAEPIRGIVSTAQGDGCWLVDADGEPTGKAILWNDSRAAGLVEQWQREGRVEACFRRSGSVTYSGLPNAILRWLGQHQPERVQRARWALTCNGWLMARMTGGFVADASDSANPFGELATGTYSESTLASFGLGPEGHRLPPIVRGADARWALLPRAAEELGLPAGLPVVMAPYDIVTTAYGSGVVREGQACVILGTTICAETIRSSVNLEGEPLGTTIPLDGGLFLRAMPTLTGCEALQWAAEMLGVDGVAELDALAAEAGPGKRSLFFLPYLSPAGERAPFLAQEASGSFHGLTLNATRSDISRAVLEGLCFVVRECLEAACGEVPLTEVRVCGGGARSDFWCQMIADVLQAPVVRPGDQEIGARGAYLFGLFAMGEVSSVAEGVAQYVRDGIAFQPQREAGAELGERFSTFKQLRSMAVPQWRAMRRG